jgi:hypothetical protein
VGIHDTGTILTITGVGLPDWSARGLKQRLAPIGLVSKVSRDLNGNAMDLSAIEFRKYETTITCEDVRVPAFDTQWPGSLVVIECVAELARGVADTAGRDDVSGSERTEGDFVFYRPILEMMVTGFNWVHDEWGQRIGWELTATEF